MNISKVDFNKEMKSKINILCLVIFTISATAQVKEIASSLKQELSKRPNFIIILTDDLGYGDVNFNLKNLDRFNNSNIQTTNLAKLASEFVVFTQQYATTPVWVGLLTGELYNVEGLHASSFEYSTTEVNEE
tara:strand:- start:15644 stop:16039 length:396 start_codon:yes stop_codon:yes gene_type:complete